VNRRVQGDVGEASALEWLTSKGATVWVPFNHSPHVDLMADWGAKPVGVQVKTSTFRSHPKNGDPRWKVAIATRGGNRSWTGLTKKFDPTRVDYLFVIVGDGRRWFIPSPYVEAASEVSLGGAKYSEFEIEAGTPFEEAVYSNDEPNTIAAPNALGECQSGQMDVTVNHTAVPTQVRILPPPSPSPSAQILFRPKRQATIPRRPCEEAGLRAGDRLRVSSDGPGRIVLERIDEAAGSSSARLASPPGARPSAR
jgi:PD-(D/E)XK nuclease superfamily protein